MKVMDLAKTKEEASQVTECMHEIDGVTTPFTDTLNIYNGLNYAQFLEAILRIAYYKKETSDQAGVPDGFKNTLEEMFANADLDIQKRAKSDPITAQMLYLSSNVFFEENYDLLAAVFKEKGMPKIDSQEISKQDLCAMLKESEILLKPKPQKAEETKEDKKKGAAADAKKEEEVKKNEPQRKFEEADVMEAIQHSSSFDDDKLIYVDYLEALVRIAEVYPFTPEELAEMGQQFEGKMMYFVTKLEHKYKSLKEAFINKIHNPSGDDIRY